MKVQQIIKTEKGNFILTLYEKRVDEKDLPFFIGLMRNLYDKNFSVRSFAERQAINAPIQGTAADIIKLAMIELNKLITADDLNAKILLQVHDELIFEIDEDNKEVSIDKIKSVMENIHLNFKDFEVPLLVDYGFGDNWGDAHQKSSSKEFLSSHFSSS